MWIMLHNTFSASYIELGDNSVIFSDKTAKQFRFALYSSIYWFTLEYYIQYAD